MLYTNYHSDYNSPFLSLAGIAEQLSVNIFNGFGIGEETALSCITNSGKNPPCCVGVDVQNSLSQFSGSYMGILYTYIYSY